MATPSQTELYNKLYEATEIMIHITEIGLKFSQSSIDLKTLIEYTENIKDEFTNLLDTINILIHDVGQELRCNNDITIEQIEEFKNNTKKYKKMRKILNTIIARNNAYYNL